MWDFLLGLFPTVVYNKGPDEQHTEYWWQNTDDKKKKKTKNMNQIKVTKYDKFLVKKKRKNQSKVTKYDKAGNYQ